MIYRLHIMRDDDESEGYEFFGSAAAAKRRRTELVRAGSYRRANLTIDHAPTPKGKGGAVSLLNLWGSHADNG